jgi:hypothetical protein
MKRIIRTLTLLVAAWRGDLAAQSAGATAVVAVGIRVDTTVVSTREIFSAWRSYLGSAPDGFTKSASWSRVDQHRWPFYNLTFSLDTSRHSA